MSFNSLGRVFRYTSWGESHGSGMGCVLDGVPPRIPLRVEEIQSRVDRRRSGLSRFTSQRREEDRVEILSGLFEGETTGAPLALWIANTDARSKDYSEIRDKFRPGHADYSYFRKYGVRDWRGGGRASARETVMRVAAGAVAAKVLGASVLIRAAVSQIGDKAVDCTRWQWESCAQNGFFCPDSEVVPLWEEALDSARKEGLSLGARLEVQACGVPAGWGAPLYAKLDADIAAALMGINGVKGVEIGAGFAVVARDGVQNADPMQGSSASSVSSSEPQFLANNAGGILGGISTGQDINAALALKPTSSIRSELSTIDNEGHTTAISTKGRHDPCIGIRAVPIAEAMLALVLADHKLLHRAQCGD